MDVSRFFKTVGKRYSTVNVVLKCVKFRCYL